MSSLLIIHYIFLSLCGIQVLYWLIFLLSFRKKPLSPQTDSIPGISVIVCAHDEEANLRQLVPRLLLQDHPDFEVIIVEDRSNDGSYDFLLGATKLDERLKMVKVTSKPNHIPGKKYALTLGIRAAKHDIVLLTDADCRPEDNSWVRTMAAHFNEGITIVTGISTYQSKPGLLNAFIRFETWMTAILYTSLTRLGVPYMGVGRNLAYRKQLFLDSKGFHSHLSVVGGDDDLFVNEHARKGNTTIAEGISSLTHSIPKDTFSEFMKQKVRHLSAGRQYRFVHKLMLAPFLLSWAWIGPAGLALMVFGLPIAAGGLMAFRWILMGTVLWLETGRFTQRFPLLAVPLMDLLYSFYYLAAGLAALFTRKIVWKT